MGERPCPHCRRLVTLTPAGKLRAHNDRGLVGWKRCDGSGLTPPPTVLTMVGGDTGEDACTGARFASNQPDEHEALWARTLCPAPTPRAP
jgi:hypothetical protein